ncbi:MAG: RNA methyltransferase [Verrucomicrobia bacterium]|nr:RNA methyltransferase [Verrucomicrobiota bacterium]
MIQLQTILSIAAPELAAYRSMKQQRDHFARRIFVAEGEKVVRRLLASSLTVVSALLAEEWFPELEPLLRARSEIIQVFIAPKSELEKLTGFHLYQGVLAIAQIPGAISLEQVLKNFARPLLLAAVDGLTNSENLGVLVRNCAAFGVQVLLVGERTAHPYIRRAVRNSMGTLFQLPLVESTCLADTLRELRRGGVRCVAAHPHTNQSTLTEADLKNDCCLVFGSEGLGVSLAVLAACDQAVAIPMPATVDSLNVSSAAAVFLYEAARQRGRM